MENKKIENISIRNLNALLSIFSSVDDFRICREKHRTRYREVIKAIVAKGFIRTHAHIANWVQEIVENGELTALTFHEIVEKSPWEWDKTSEYFDRLEEEGIIQYFRDSQGRKMCCLNIDDQKRNRQINNLLVFYKEKKEDALNNFQKSRKFSFEYNKKLCEWQQMRSKIEQLKPKINQATSSSVKKFISNIAKILNNSTEEDLEDNLLDFLKRNPLMIYSIERRC